MPRRPTANPYRHLPYNKSVAECYLILRVLKGATFTASQVVCTVETEAQAQTKVQELDSFLQSLVGADLVHSQGNGMAVNTGRKVTDLLGMLGIQQIGHMWAKSEMGGNIVVPQKRLVVPA
jgi:hypothetical protein